MQHENGPSLPKIDRLKAKLAIFIDKSSVCIDAETSNDVLQNCGGLIFSRYSGGESDQLSQMRQETLRVM